ncbi:MAG TPA: hypothetical protein PLE30_02995 [Candidatus Kapabacteria bacterium]|nr:hypothetical protein [Candidatus Kapabacteria bacterium]
MWIEVFKVGTHKDKNGHSDTYTQDSLAAIASDYNTKIQSYPNLIMPVLNSHDNDAIKLGTIKQLTLNNDILLADIDIDDSEIIRKMQNNEIQNISIGLSENNLTHIALLENELPAVEGLLPIQESIAVEALSVQDKTINNDIAELKEKYKQLNKGFSPISLELAEGILENLAKVDPDISKSIGNNFIKFIEDLQKSYLTREYSHYKSNAEYEYRMNFTNSSSDRQLLHAEIIKQLKNNPSLNYEQALLKVIQ